MSLDFQHVPLFIWGRSDLMYIFDQLLSAKGYEYAIAVVFLFIFIVFYKFLSTDRVDGDE